MSRGRVAYSQNQIAEALALSDLVGAERTSKDLGIHPDTVRRWRQRAGRSPDMLVATDELERAYQMALARVSADLASGRLRGHLAAIAMGILKDKVDRQRREKPPEPPPDGSLLLWIGKEYSPRLAKLAQLAITVAVRDELRKVVAANPMADLYLAEDDEEPLSPASDAAFEAWSRKYLASLGDLDKWKAAYDEREAAEAEERRVRWPAVSRPIVAAPTFDLDALLAKADAYLGGTA